MASQHPVLSLQAPVLLTRHKYRHVMPFSTNLPIGHIQSLQQSLQPQATWQHTRASTGAIQAPRKVRRGQRVTFLKPRVGYLSYLYSCVQLTICRCCMTLATFPQSLLPFKGSIWCDGKFPFFSNIIFPSFVHSQGRHPQPDPKAASAERTPPEMTRPKATRTSMQRARADQPSTLDDKGMAPPSTSPMGKDTTTEAEVSAVHKYRLTHSC
jgi:hypothetical protein